jgi:NAD(P)-dependent dehydrogenase (short-subunit alcohol dehydrogenase family)
MLSPLNPRITRWQDHRVWIVGASSGIGAALARELLARGARVALSARREEPLRELAGAALGEGRALVAPVDVLDAAAVRAAHQSVIEQWQGIDLVVWVAGTYQSMRAFDFDLVAARRIMQVNVDGLLNGLACVLPMLISQRAGAIGIVSSVAGYGGLPRALVYGPSKAALNNLAQSLYLDLHPLGVGVHLINPGFVETPLTDLNDFEMPALMPVEAAARRMVEGFEQGRFEIHFPRRFTLVLKLLSLLPHRLYFSLVGRITGARPAASAQTAAP